MLGREVGERAEPARARAGGGDVERGAVRLERVGERVDPRDRVHGGDREHRRRVAQRPQRHPQVADRPGGDRAEVGLGHDQHVGHLHDPGLQELQDVAGAGLDHDRDGVGRLGHLGLGLADADRLDHDDVEGRRERVGGGARRGGEAAEPPARRHRADEEPAVARIGVDPRAVAEQRAARALRGRVDGEHGDAPPARPPGACQRAQQRGLPRARRAGDADDVPGRLAAQSRGRDLGEERGDRLALSRRAVLEQVERGGRRRDVAVAQPRAERRGLRRAGRHRCARPRSPRCRAGCA